MSAPRKRARGLGAWPGAAVVLALAGGTLLPLSMAPFGHWYLAPLAIALLFGLLEQVPERLLTLALAFGLGKYAVGVSWIYFSIRDYGNASVLLAAGLVALFVVGLTLLFVWTQFFALKVCYRRAPILASRAAVFVALWVLWEWFQTWVLTGFPWLLAGAGQVDSPFGGFAPVGGVLLVGAAVVTVAVLPLLGWHYLRQEAPKSAAGVLLGGLLVLAGGAWLQRLSWVSLGQPRSVALVQGNVDQATKWHPENRGPIVQLYSDLSEPHWGRDLILWPEASITLLEHQAEAYLRRWDRRGREAQTTLLLGLPSVEPDPADPQGYRFHNLALALGAGSGRYKKRRLVPFGEYVPLERWLRGAIDFFDLPMSRARPGAATQPLLLLNGVPAALAICYEIAYPALVGADAGTAGVLVTLSNDAWFGTSIGPHQHLELARMRALENGRYLLRATNNGITAIVDERGRVLKSLPQFQPGVLVGAYRPAEGLTPFARFGSLSALALVVLVLAAVLSRNAILARLSISGPRQPPRDRKQEQR